MSFSAEWEKVYKSGAHESHWPWSNVVSLTYKYLHKKEGKKVLELGCGAGANIPFFQAVGARYYGIEGSRYQVNLLNQRFQDENVMIMAGDFTKEIPFDTDFDLILDRGSITCNSTKPIRNTVDMVYKKLAGGGLFFGVDWFTDMHDAFINRPNDTEMIDDWTCIFHSGYFDGLGAIHFFEKEHVVELLSKFEVMELNEKVITQHVPEKNVWATWNFVAKKSEKG